MPPDAMTWLLGPTGLLVACLYALWRNGRDWHSDASYQQQVKRADRAEAERDKALDLALQVLQAGRESASVARTAVEAVKERPVVVPPPPDPPPASRWRWGQREPG